MGQASCLGQAYTARVKEFIMRVHVLIVLIIPHSYSGHACLATNNAVLCITKTLRHQHGKGNQPRCDNRSISVCIRRLKTQRETDGSCLNFKLSQGL